MVDTFPDTRGRLFRMSHFFIFCFSYIKTWLLSSLVSAAPVFGGSAEPCEAIGVSLRTQVRTSWQNKNNSAVILERRAEAEWWWKKKHNLTLSEESGIGYRKMHLTPTFFAQILTAPVGRVWRLTHFCSVALLLEKWFACFPCPGTACVLYSFLYVLI